MDREPSGLQESSSRVSYVVETERGLWKHHIDQLRESTPRLFLLPNALMTVRIWTWFWRLELHVTHPHLPLLLLSIHVLRLYLKLVPIYNIKGDTQHSSPLNQKPGEQKHCLMTEIVRRLSITSRIPRSRCWPRGGEFNWGWRHHELCRVEEHQHQLTHQCSPNIIGTWEWGLMGGAFYGLLG